jgi:hypothetical protein
MVEAKLLLCLIKHFAMDVFGGTEVKFHAFLASSVDVDVSRQFQDPAFSREAG